MISALRPSGALLAAIALWAIGLLVLTAFGLGGQVGLHPSNPALMPPLPAVQLDEIGSRLGPASDYAEIGNRPLLSADRRPSAVTTGTGGDAEAPLDVRLTSVLITDGLKIALLQGTEDGLSRRVRLGDLLDGTAWRLVLLEPRRAVFEGPQGRSELELRVFDGTGGQPPTAAPATTSAASAANAAPKPELANAPTEAPAPATAPAADTTNTPATPEQQVEAIRRRIEARRAMRAAEQSQQRSPPGAPQQQVQ